MNPIGFLGTGLLGRPMVERLARAGKKVVAWNRTTEKLCGLDTLGVESGLSPRTVIEAAPVTILMLADGNAIEEVLFRQVGGKALHGKNIIQMGTIGPWESIKFKERLAAFGGRYVEAPVMGSIPQAELGELIVMVGCETDELATFSELLAIFGPVVRVGRVGDAATLKLALNHLIAAHVTAISASLGLVRGAGLSEEIFMDVLRKTNLYAPMFDKKVPLMRDGKYESPHFTTKNLLKDASLFEEAAKKVGVATKIVERIVETLKIAVHRGLGDVDYAAVYEVIVGNGKRPAR